MYERENGGWGEVGGWGGTSFPEATRVHHDDKMALLGSLAEPNEPVCGPASDKLIELVYMSSRE